MSKGYFSYIRVSTARQGQTGTSLEEQHAAIQAYAKRWNLSIVREFEEKETAAKSGRPVFRQMLSGLKQSQADGVIIHKIDRSARNLRDWAELGEVIDRGVEVHFANENLDLDSRGGRLSADIQAVVAADYIRNLREEVKKGFYGRLKQGFYPMPAPIGYLDQGAAKPKVLDPVRAPLVRKMFDLYGSGHLSIRQLEDEMFAGGLRTRHGKRVTKNSIAGMLHNPFYTGLIRIGTSNELFVGQHKALVPKPVFDRVQIILGVKQTKQVRRHEFIFKGLLRCSECQTLLVGERQKGFVYYRCHKKSCSQKTIREEAVEAAVGAILHKIKFTPLENRYLHEEIGRRYDDVAALQESHRQSLTLQLDQLRDRLSNLTDAYVDGVVDKETYVEKKNRVLSDELTLKDQLSRVNTETVSSQERVTQILELANKAYLGYEMGTIDEKREMVQSVSSNLCVREKTVSIKLKSPFEVIVSRQVVPNGGPQRDTARTLSRLVSALLKCFVSRKDQDDGMGIYKPVPITPGRLKLAFRRANGVDQERLAAKI
jgi:DNA invertase Pin-like site-specific DNA recombinase